MNFIKDDQKTVINFASQFIKFYYDNLNSKNYNQIMVHIKNFTIFSFQKERYTSNNILTYFNQLQQKNCQFHNIKFDTLHSGSRRVNILVTGTMSYNNGFNTVSQQFSEYLHIATGKNDEIWIQLSMFLLN